MSRNRFRLPAPPTPTPSTDAFVMVPQASLPNQSEEQAAAQRALYEWAFEEARAVVQPPLTDRDLLGFWN